MVLRPSSQSHKSKNMLTINPQLMLTLLDYLPLRWLFIIHKTHTVLLLHVYVAINEVFVYSL